MRLDLGMHGIGCEIDLPRPANGAEVDEDGSEDSRVGQFGKDARVRRVNSRSISTVPSKPSLKRTCNRQPGSASTLATRQGGPPLSPKRAEAEKMLSR